MADRNAGIEPAAYGPRDIEMGRELVYSAAREYIRQSVPLCLLFGVHQRKNLLICACGNPACPCPGKHPRTRDWPNRAITSEPELHRQFPSTGAVNLALVLRKRVFVIDVDAKGNGPKTMSTLERQHGKLPSTLTTATSQGGYHLFFKAPLGVHAGNSVKQVGSGIDVRGLNGYVILPPSLHITGASYQFLPPATIADLGHIAHAPPWLLKLVLKFSNRSLQFSQRRPPTFVGKGERNQQAARLTGHLLNYCPLEWVECFLGLWNRKFCVPPSPPAEVQSVFRNISRRHETRNQGRRP